VPRSPWTRTSVSAPLPPLESLAHATPPQVAPPWPASRLELTARTSLSSVELQSPRSPAAGTRSNSSSNNCNNNSNSGDSRSSYINCTGAVTHVMMPATPHRLAPTTTSQTPQSVALASPALPSGRLPSRLVQRASLRRAKQTSVPVAAPETGHQSPRQPEAESPILRTDRLLAELLAHERAIADEVTAAKRLRRTAAARADSDGCRYDEMGATSLTPPNPFPRESTSNL